MRSSEIVGPPSPLSGAYLLIVLPEPRCLEHKEAALQKLTKSLLSWDSSATGVNIDRELADITHQSPQGDDSTNGEKIIQAASDSLVLEILIHPQLNTFRQCLRNLLSSFTRHRHVIHAGYCTTGSGSWILQDGSFEFGDFLETLKEKSIQRLHRVYEKNISLHLHCSPEGSWTQEGINRDPIASSVKTSVNPSEVLPAPSSGVSGFVRYVSDILPAVRVEKLLEASDVVGNIRFNSPTLYVFPGGNGDSALFGINGFNILLDGGFGRKPCFWDFTRHMDRLDAVFMSGFGTSSVGGLSSVVALKSANTVYPHIGHLFGNIPFSNSSPGEKDPLTLNPLETGQQMYEDLKKLQLKPQPLYRDDLMVPMNLYHKVGHGTLDMFILSPSRDSKEVKEFLRLWKLGNPGPLGSAQGNIRLGGKDFQIPLVDLVSVSVLMVWQPSDPDKPVTRLLFSGSCPQTKILEGLEKLGRMDYLKSPVAYGRDFISEMNSIKKKKIKTTEEFTKPLQRPVVEKTEVRVVKTVATSPRPKENATVNLKVPVPLQLAKKPESPKPNLVPKIAKPKYDVKSKIDSSWGSGTSRPSSTELTKKPEATAENTQNKPQKTEKPLPAKTLTENPAKKPKADLKKIEAKVGSFKVSPLEQKKTQGKKVDKIQMNPLLKGRGKSLDRKGKKDSQGEEKKNDKKKVTPAKPFEENKTSKPKANNSVAVPKAPLQKIVAKKSTRDSKKETKELEKKSAGSVQFKAVKRPQKTVGSVPAVPGDPTFTMESKFSSSGVPQAVSSPILNKTFDFDTEDRFQFEMTDKPVVFPIEEVKLDDHHTESYNPDTSTEELKELVSTDDDIHGGNDFISGRESHLEDEEEIEMKHQSFTIEDMEITQRRIKIAEEAVTLDHFSRISSSEMEVLNEARHSTDTAYEETTDDHSVLSENIQSPGSYGEVHDLDESSRSSSSSEGSLNRDTKQEFVKSVDSRKDPTGSIQNATLDDKLGSRKEGQLRTVSETEFPAKNSAGLMDDSFRIERFETEKSEKTEGSINEVSMIKQNETVVQGLSEKLWFGSLQDHSGPVEQLELEHQTQSKDLFESKFHIEQKTSDSGSCIDLDIRNPLNYPSTILEHLEQGFQTSGQGEEDEESSDGSEFEFHRPSKTVPAEMEQDRVVIKNQFHEVPEPEGFLSQLEEKSTEIRDSISDVASSILNPELENPGTIKLKTDNVGSPGYVPEPEPRTAAGELRETLLYVETEIVNVLEELGPPIPVPRGTVRFELENKVLEQEETLEENSRIQGFLGQLESTVEEIREAFQNNLETKNQENLEVQNSIKVLEQVPVSPGDDPTSTEKQLTLEKQIQANREYWNQPDLDYWAKPFVEHSIQTVLEQGLQNDLKLESSAVLEENLEQSSGIGEHEVHLELYARTSAEDEERILEQEKILQTRIASEELGIGSFGVLEVEKFEEEDTNQFNKENKENARGKDPFSLEFHTNNGTDPQIPRWATRNTDVNLQEIDDEDISSADENDITQHETLVDGKESVSVYRLAQDFSGTQQLDSINEIADEEMEVDEVVASRSAGTVLQVVKSRFDSTIDQGSDDEVYEEFKAVYIDRKIKLDIINDPVEEIVREKPQPVKPIRNVRPRPILDEDSDQDEVKETFTAIRKIRQVESIIGNSRIDFDMDVSLNLEALPESEVDPKIEPESDPEIKRNYSIKDPWGLPNVDIATTKSTNPFEESWNPNPFQQDLSKPVIEDNFHKHIIHSSSSESEGEVDDPAIVIESKSNIDPEEAPKSLSSNFSSKTYDIRILERDTQVLVTTNVEDNDIHVEDVVQFGSSGPSSFHSNASVTSEVRERGVFNEHFTTGAFSSGPASWAGYEDSAEIDAVQYRLRRYDTIDDATSDHSFTSSVSKDHEHHTENPEHHEEHFGTLNPFSASYQFETEQEYSFQNVPETFQTNPWNMKSLPQIEESEEQDSESETEANSGTLTTSGSSAAAPRRSSPEVSPRFQHSEQGIQPGSLITFSTWAKMTEETEIYEERVELNQTRIDPELHENVSEPRKLSVSFSGHVAERYYNPFSTGATYSSQAILDDDREIRIVPESYPIEQASQRKLKISRNSSIDLVEISDDITILHDSSSSGSDPESFQSNHGTFQASAIANIATPMIDPLIIDPLIIDPFAAYTSEQDDQDQILRSWGKPLNLPAPIAPQLSNGSRKSPLSNGTKNVQKSFKAKEVDPVYVDLAFVPHHGDPKYSNVEFFKKIRARYYVFSGLEPSTKVLDALVEAKESWNDPDKDLDVTIIPTYDSDSLGAWITSNEALLARNRIDLAPSASRCTINLQDHKTSCSAYRLEF